MGRTARAGVVCLMLLAVGLARLIEVQLDPGPTTPELRLSGEGDKSAEKAATTVDASVPRAQGKAPPPPPPTEAAPATSSAPRTYTVKPGDTLGSIAKKVYGTSRGWERILEANKRVIPSPTKIRAGVELVIPPPVEASDRRTPGTRGA